MAAIALAVVMAASPLVTPTEDMPMDWESVWPTTFAQLVPDERPHAPEKQVLILQTRARQTLPVPSEEMLALAARHFRAEDVDLMVRVAWCESRWDANAKNPNSTASGLWQHLKGWWSGAWGVTGAFDPFDPEQSAAAAAALLYETSSGIENWSPSRHCWR